MPITLDGKDWGLIALGVVVLVLTLVLIFRKRKDDCPDAADDSTAAGGIKNVRDLAKEFVAGHASVTKQLVQNDVAEVKSITDRPHVCVHPLNLPLNMVISFPLTNTGQCSDKAHWGMQGGWTPPWKVVANDFVTQEQADNINGELGYIGRWVNCGSQIKLEAATGWRQAGQDKKPFPGGVSSEIEFSRYDQNLPGPGGPPGPYIMTYASWMALQAAAKADFAGDVTIDEPLAPGDYFVGKGDWEAPDGPGIYPGVLRMVVLPTTQWRASWSGKAQHQMTNDQGQWAPVPFVRMPNNVANIVRWNKEPIISPGGIRWG